MLPKSYSLPSDFLTVGGYLIQMPPVVAMMPQLKPTVECHPQHVS